MIVVCLGLICAAVTAELIKCARDVSSFDPCAPRDEYGLSIQNPHSTNTKSCAHISIQQVNFMAFHKILKKHDKNLPAHACKQFYINRMHNQAWVRGDYSDVVVRLSSIYSALRNDHTAEENKDAAQSFLRSTTKYWVRTEDVSKVKYAVLKHLPVFLQKTSTGESDSQLTNSVYFDNDQLGEFW